MEKEKILFWRNFFFRSFFVGVFFAILLGLITLTFWNSLYANACPGPALDVERKTVGSLL